ncbi:MATE family efflux transporter [Leptolyngbya sp. FACHB-16]|nr:MATE family efflux transporter [Leptolyngbya sp. FACHB-8]MBD2155384.1 MATE family efflux transporter [Leptolyngbya sp. FACHB-16]
MVPLAGLVDTAFLGHLDDIRYLGGVALGAVLFSYLYWTFGFLRMGTTGTTAQAVGRGDDEAVWLTLLRNGAIALTVGFGLLLLQYPIREAGFWLLQAAPEVEQAGKSYYNAQIWGAPAALMDFVLVGWFLGRERGRTVLVMSLVNNSVNVVLNYWFIFRLGMASQGAGAATAVSQYAMMLTGFLLLSREWNWARIRAIARRLRTSDTLLADFWLNSNIVIRTFALISTFALFTNFSASMGTVTLAANTLLLQVVTFSAYFVDGIAFATENFAGMFCGGGKGQKLVALTQLAGSTCLGLGLAIALVFISFPVPLFGLLTRHNDVLQMVQQYVGWLLPVLGFGSLAYMLDGYFLGLTAGHTLRQSALLSTLVGFVPLGAIASFLHNPHLLWLALSGFMLTRTLTLGSQLSATFHTPSEANS